MQPCLRAAMVPGAGNGSVSTEIIAQDSVIINLHGDFETNVHMRPDIEFLEKLSQMNIFEIARLLKDFKSWSLAH
jgi:hypothetical protein